MVAYRAYKEVDIYVIEVTGFNLDIRCGLRGHMEAATASEATIMAVPGNMDIYARVIEVACIKSEVKFDLQGCLEVTIALEATEVKVFGKQQRIPQ